ncbi:MAG: nitroreductase [Pseudohongiellaceae bacterium]|nr:nitroreductase [Pseudohongiellaceae bacterium]
MDAITNLHTRISFPRVDGPIPDESAIENIFKAALRAPDHGQLRPWRFLRIQGESLAKLGQLFAEASLQDKPDLDEEALTKIANKAERAPLIITTISESAPHPKIPEFEQDLSAAAATQSMLLAAHAQGIGAVWRTGAMAEHPHVKTGLGLRDHEKIIAFLYIGTPKGSAKTIRPLAIEDFVQDW